MYISDPGSTPPLSGTSPSLLLALGRGGGTPRRPETVFHPPAPEPPRPGVVWIDFKSAAYETSSLNTEAPPPHVPRKPPGPATRGARLLVMALLLLLLIIIIIIIIMIIIIMTIMIMIMMIMIIILLLLLLLIIIIMIIMMIIMIMIMIIVIMIRAATLGDPSRCPRARGRSGLEGRVLAGVFASSESPFEDWQARCSPAAHFCQRRSPRPASNALVRARNAIEAKPRAGIPVELMIQ